MLLKIDSLRLLPVPRTTMKNVVRRRLARKCLQQGRPRFSAAMDPAVDDGKAACKIVARVIRPGNFHVYTRLVAMIDCQTNSRSALSGDDKLEGRICALATWRQA